MFYFYILHSASSDKYYVGITNDLDRRFFEHNNSVHNTYTSKHRPWLIKKVISISTERSFAMRAEKAVKKTKSRVVVENIILNVNSITGLAQLVRVPMYRD